MPRSEASRKAEKTHPYNRMPSRSRLTCGSTVAIARASNPTSVTTRNSPIEVARYAGASTPVRPPSVGSSAMDAIVADALPARRSYFLCSMPPGIAMPTGCNCWAKILLKFSDTPCTSQPPSRYM